MIGTTHFTNAVVEAAAVAAAVVRLGLPAHRALPPLVDWPDGCAAVDGSRISATAATSSTAAPISPLDRDELARGARHPRPRSAGSAIASRVLAGQP